MDQQLRPWIEALTQHAGAQFSPRDESVDHARSTGVVWLNWSWSMRHHDDDETLQLVFEAFELLAVLSHADQAAWRALVEHAWAGVFIGCWKNAPLSKVFVLGCDVHVTMTGLLPTNSERFFVDHIDSIVSDEYKTLRFELEEMIQANELCTATPVAPIRISVDDGGWGVHRTESAPKLGPLLYEIGLLAALQSSKKNLRLQYPRKFEPLFCIQEVRVTAFFSLHTPSDLECFHNIASCGVHVDNLQLNRINITPEEAPRFTPMLQQFLACTEPDVSTHQFAPSRLILVDQYATSETYDGIFSALIDSRSARTFYHMIPDDRAIDDRSPRTPARDRWWQWIAASIFSRHATNTIDDVYLHGSEFTMDGARLLAETLRLGNPMAVLFPGPVNDSNISTVTASTFRLTDDFDDEETLITTSPVKRIRVLGVGEGGESLRVLLPGWGQAWVRRSDVIASDILSSLPPQKMARSVRSIRTLTMDFPDSGGFEIPLAILQAVGSGIQRLILVNWVNEDDPLTTEWLHATLQACSQLEELRLENVPIVSLESIPRGYESGICRVSRLVLDVSIPDFDAKAAQFFQYLADSNHAMTRHLRGLVLHVRLLQAVSAEMIEALSSLPRQNYWLRELTLTFVTNTVLPALNESQASLLEEIHGHNGEPVYGRLEPLELKSKVAFLSVIWSDTTKTKRIPQALQSLDARAVGLIFQFAAENYKRHISISFRE